MDMQTTSTSTPTTSSSNSALARPGRYVLRAGLPIGAALFVFETIHGVVSANPLPLPVTAIFFLLAMAGLLAAGYLAARTSGTLGAGALAGLLAGALLGLGYALGVSIAILTNFAALRAIYVSAAASAHVAYSDQLTIIGTIVTVVLSLLVSLGAGAACGAIGGLVGKRQSA